MGARFKTVYPSRPDGSVVICGVLWESETGSVQDCCCTGLTEAQNQVLKARLAGEQPSETCGPEVASLEAEILKRLSRG